jgi:hypothetical protein
MTNGDYLLVCEDKVIARLDKDADDAIQRLYRYYLNNAKLKPDVYLVQVVASLEYPPPEIKTLAHERMT